MAEGQSKWKHKFYDEVEPIKLRDPLAIFLGAMDESEVFVFTYADCIKLAGHSCPAVSGAYKITQKALKALYGNGIPVRGEIKVTVLGAPTTGANGPMANVISFITGACGESGFGGLGGKFSRADKLIFDTKREEFGAFIFEREDTGKKVKVKYHPELLPYAEDMSWQERVKKVLFEEVKGLFDISEVK